MPLRRAPPARALAICALLLASQAHTEPRRLSLGRRLQLCEGLGAGELCVGSDGCDVPEDQCVCDADGSCVPPDTEAGLVPQWVIGVVLYCIGAMMINLGSNIVKYGHSAHEKAEGQGDAQGQTRAARLRAAGWTLFSLGGVFNFFSFSYGTQSLLASLAAVQFVTNIYFGAAVNGETVTLRTVIGTIVICAGVTLVVIVGPKAEENYDISDLIRLWIQWPILTWIGGNAVVFVVLEVVRRKIYAREAAALKAAAAQARGDASASPGSTSDTVLRAHAAMLKNWRGVVYGSTSAILGSQQTLFMKSLSELLKGLLTRGEFDALINPFLYAIVAGFVVSMVFWLHRLNRGLAEFDALFIVPVMQVQWTMLSVMEGIIYFEEYREFGMVDGLIFFASLFVIFFGVYLLSSGDRGGSPDGALVDDQLPLLDGEESWDPSDPTTPRIITAHGIKDLDANALEKFGMLLSISQVAGREAWQLARLQEAEARDSQAQAGGQPRTRATVA